jgi:uracil-DNA glycosylase family protein
MLGDPWHETVRGHRAVDGGGWIGVVRVADLELDASARWTETVLGDGHFRELPDDVPPRPDPVASIELQAQADRSRQRSVQLGLEVERFEHDQPGTDAPGVGGQPSELGILPARESGRQVDHQQVDGSTRQQGAGQREALGRLGRTKDHQPAQVDPSTDRLEGIEGPGQVEVGGDGASGLGLGQAAQGEGGLAARGVAADGRTRLSRQPARAQHGIEEREAGRDDLITGGPQRVRARRGLEERLQDGCQRALGGYGTGSTRARGRPGIGTLATAEANRGASPASLQPCQGSAQIDRRRDHSGYARADTHGPVHDRTSVLIVNQPLDWTQDATDPMTDDAGTAPGRRASAAAAGGTGSASDFLPPDHSLPALRSAAEGCRGCGLYERATQTVFGAGSSEALIMLIGEQPGDKEDLAGEPFVGPAGKLLDSALQEAGIDRRSVYVTNAVKHFKWRPAGKRRLHEKPDQAEITACRPWLEAEIAEVQPRIVVCLGATAAQALIGREFRVTRDRGRFYESDLGPLLTATVHPSSILRAADDAARQSEMRAFIADLAAVAERAAQIAAGR